MPEVTQCPQCQRKLNVQEAQLGETVQCPVCGTFFTATVLSTQRAPTPPRDEPPLPRYDPPPPRSRDYDDRRTGYPDDYGRGRRYGGYRDPYAEPAPHRGGVILALGLAGFLLSCIPFVGWIMGGIALSMAGTDLPRIDRGAMDREGRGMTVAGQVFGIIAVVLSSLAALILCTGLPGLLR